MPTLRPDEWIVVKRPILSIEGRLVLEGMLREIHMRSPLASQRELPTLLRLASEYADALADAVTQPTSPHDARRRLTRNRPEPAR